MALEMKQKRDEAIAAEIEDSMDRNADDQNKHLIKER